MNPDDWAAAASDIAVRRKEAAAAVARVTAATEAAVASGARLGLSNYRMAQALGVSQPTIARMLRT